MKESKVTEHAADGAFIYHWYVLLLNLDVEYNDTKNVYNKTAN